MQQKTSKSEMDLYDQMVVAKPSGAPKYRSLARDLAVFGAADLYEYSCPKGVANPRKASSESLVGSADIRINDYGKITSERSAAERLRSRAREIFGDESERERYDAYLQWVALKGVFDTLTQARADGKVAAQTVADARTELTNLLDGDEAKAQALLEDYDKNHDGNLGLVQCEDPAETEVSNVSDKPDAQPWLEKTCPSCGSRVKQNSRFCSYCRYDFVRHAVVSAPPMQIPIQNRTSPPNVQPIDDSQRNQAKWPTVVIIVAVIVIVVSITVIATTLSGTAHALQGVQAGVSAIPVARAAFRDGSESSCQ